MALGIFSGLLRRSQRDDGQPPAVETKPGKETNTAAKPHTEDPSKIPCRSLWGV